MNVLKIDQQQIRKMGAARDENETGRLHVVVFFWINVCFVFVPIYVHVSIM